MKGRILPISVMLLIIMSWEGAVRIFNIPEYLLPAPSVVIMALGDNTPLLIHHTMTTALEATLGFIMALVLGVTLAVLFVHSKMLERALYPYVIASQSIPVIAIAPLLVVWFDTGLLPKVLVAMIICFFPIVVNTVKGLNSVSQEALDVFDTFAATRMQVFFKLRVPTALPYIFAAMKMSATLSVIGAIVAEFTGADRGLGYMILIASHRLETTQMFVGLLLSSILGMVAFYTIVWLEKTFVRK